MRLPFLIPFFGVIKILLSRHINEIGALSTVDVKTSPQVAHCPAHILLLSQLIFIRFMPSFIKFQSTNFFTRKASL
jgi:hypothetical protein